MNFLTVDNKSYSMNEIPEEVDDLRYCVLDYSDKKNVDYYWIPLLFLESFHVPAAEISIGKYNIQMPIDWSIVIGDKNNGELEAIELKKLNDRDFQTFSINPITGFFPEFFDVKINGITSDKKWFFPKLKYGHIIAVPLCEGENPPCVFFVRDINKLPDQLDITQMV